MMMRGQSLGTLDEPASAARTIQAAFRGHSARVQLQRHWAEEVAAAQRELTEQREVRAEQRQLRLEHRRTELGQPPPGTEHSPMTPPAGSGSPSSSSSSPPPPPSARPHTPPGRHPRAAAATVPAARTASSAQHDAACTVQAAVSAPVTPLNRQAPPPPPTDKRPPPNCHPPPRVPVLDRCVGGWHGARCRPSASSWRSGGGQRSARPWSASAPPTSRAGRRCGRNGSRRQSSRRWRRQRRRSRSGSGRGGGCGRGPRAARLAAAPAVSCGRGRERRRRCPAAGTWRRSGGSVAQRPPLPDRAAGCGATAARDLRRECDHQARHISSLPRPAPPRPACLV
eukprot:COSAG01_NODE_5453_length_4256_cov_3.218186_2_plen_340_part_00